MWALPGYLWKMPTKEKVMYLTFDDGPIPEITDWVLAELKKYEAKATFFVVGNNVKKNPEIFKRVLDAGHKVGNHTFNHVSGWKVNTETYLKEVKSCQEAMDVAGFREVNADKKLLFRPPYMRSTSTQKAMMKNDYTFVMWDVIAGDFDPNLDPELCYTKTRDAISEGSIVVLHDSLKAAARMQYVLPKLLAHFHELGWVFKALE